MKLKSPLRIGVLGLTHDHVWYNLKDLKGLRDATLVAVADPNQPLLDRAKQQFDCATYTDYQAMLDGEKLDAVYIFGDNATGVELAELAAAHGPHIMIEKPLASTLEGADRILAAVRNHKVRLMVSWPFAWWPQLQAAIALARSGKIGNVWEVKYRAAHNGPREMGCSKYFYEWLYQPELNGAGALMDYCCYGAMLARVLLGMPSRVSGVAGRFCKEDILAEDNAVIVMTYPRGLAIAEASWSQVGYFNTYTPMIYGTKGMLMVEPRAGGKLWLATEKDPKGSAIRVPKQPAHLRHASAHFVHCLLTGEEFNAMADLRFSRDAQEILEAGLLSVEDGAQISLPLDVV